MSFPAYFQPVAILPTKTELVESPFMGPNLRCVMRYHENTTYGMSDRDVILADYEFSSYLPH